MIPVAQAIQMVTDTVRSLDRVRQVSLPQALGHVLATDIHAPLDLPPFRQSAMDGYAVHRHEALEYTLVGEVQAGDASNPVLKPGEAVRIFTGAPVPDDADAVMMQEKVQREGNHIVLQHPPAPQQAIRPVGEQIKAGALALSKGTLVTPATVGLFATLGLAEVPVVGLPRVSVVVTGNELRPAGTALKRGEIFESNAVMLEATLAKEGIAKIDMLRVPDNYEATVETLRTAVSNSDAVLISGGISVGDYDFVGRALEAIGVTEVFYKVKQKPGKPLFFGMAGSKPVFALPGNPASALSCFYVYALPALRLLAGQPDPHLPRNTCQASNGFTRKGDRAQFLKARVSGDTVTLLDRQASSMILSFAQANALAYVPETLAEIVPGTTLEVLMLP